MLLEEIPYQVGSGNALHRRLAKQPHALPDEPRELSAVVVNAPVIVAVNDND